MMTYECKYCRKSFMREHSLIVHSCEARKRHEQRSERGVELGFQAYIKFYEMTQGSAKNKTYEDFCESAYYRAFVKFGRHCVDIKAINPARFTEWVLKNHKKLDQWCSDKFYGEYLHDYLRIENVQDALARAVEYSIEWAITSEAQPHDILRYGNTNKLCYAISTGRISPWIIYNCESGQKFLSDLNAEQLSIVWSTVDSDFWQKKFRDYPGDQAYAQHILEKAGW